VTTGGLGLLAAAAYLRTATTSSTGAHVVLGGCCTPLARLLSRLPPSTPRQISAVFKIVVGLVQCLSTLRRLGSGLGLDPTPNPTPMPTPDPVHLAQVRVRVRVRPYPYPYPYAHP